jgi:hypothetical protein
MDWATFNAKLAWEKAKAENLKACRVNVIAERLEQRLMRRMALKEQRKWK